jgi:membrane protein required for colicin V production
LSGIDISQLVITIVVVCLFLWRISYGINNGLFAEATGLIAVIAAFVAVYYSTNILGEMLNARFGNVIPKIGYLVVAFAVYRIMTAIADALRKVKTIPIVGGIDRFLGAILGFVEAAAIILLIEYVTDIGIIKTIIMVCYKLVVALKNLIEKLL